MSFRCPLRPSQDQRTPIISNLKSAKRERPQSAKTVRFAEEAVTATANITYDRLTQSKCRINLIYKLDNYWV